MKTIKEINFEIAYIRLQLFEWNRTKTAESLGISIRAMRNWIQEMKSLGYKIPYNPLHINADHHKYRGLADVQNDEGFKLMKEKYPD